VDKVYYFIFKFEAGSGSDAARARLGWGAAVQRDAEAPLARTAAAPQIAGTHAERRRKNSSDAGRALACPS